ncbi:unnamed protein product [Amoebophrya sp. A120]|nr:unnamed protein product [Amoebophrya sp. A120]|eukprot:GSA120T00019877001.1
MVYSRAELSIRVPVAFMGGLIGYQGDTIRKIQSDSGSTIKVFPRDPRVVDMRQVIITKDVEAGVEAMFDVFERELKNATKGQLARLGEDHLFSFKVDVASNQIGAVIGRRGQGAHSIRETSGCTVKIQGEGEVQLSGKLPQIREAMRAVWASIKEIPSLYNIMRVSESFYKSPLAGPIIECVLRLPDDTVGMLIGRRGNTISTIRRECTGVRIDIESGTNPGDPAALKTNHHGGIINQGLGRGGMPDEPTREVVLRGTMRATCRAHQMIAALVENDMRRKNRAKDAAGVEHDEHGWAASEMGVMSKGPFGTPETAPTERESPEMSKA